MKRIIFVPTSHIAEQSLLAVRRAIDKERPDCVAVELDMNRYYAMQQGSQSNMDALRALGVTTFLVYFFMKSLQSWLGKKTGIFPGTEMLSAVQAATEKDIQVFFIDRDIRLTFFDIKKIPFREKLKLVWFILKVPFLVILSKLSSQTEKIDLSKVPEKEVISEAMLLFKREFPSFYRILVTDRDLFMAKNVKKLAERFDNIVVVVGAGHYEGMRRILQSAAAEK